MTYFQTHVKFFGRYGVGLLAVQKDKIGSTIQLNPGSKHTLRGTDICYYMSITEEEQMTLLTKEQSKRRSSFSHVATTIAGIGLLFCFPADGIVRSW